MTGVNEYDVASVEEWIAPFLTTDSWPVLALLTVTVTSSLVLSWPSLAVRRST